MMVEAGGTEATWRLLRGRRAEGHRGGHRRGPRGAKTWIKASIELQNAAASPRSSGRGPIAEIPYELHARLRRRRVRARSPSRPPTDHGRGDDHRRQGRAQRPPRRDPRGPAARAVRHARRARARSPAASKEIKAAFRSLHEEGRPQPHRQRGRAHRRPRHHRPPAAVGRGRHPPDRARLRPVPAGRDPGAQRHHPRHAPHGPAARHHRPRRPASATCTTTTFPPYSTGETGRVGSPKRREIGHGVLAERALLPVVPVDGGVALHAAPRVRGAVSNGSTSMASVCGSTLSLMDAGVPIKAPVAGIAMGLVYADGKYTTLTDILGAEDAFGDMDFKVAGTRDVRHRPAARHQDRRPPRRRAAPQALQQAKDARLKILEVMDAAIAEPRAEVRAHRPEDRQLRDPDGQDRRGHRAQGQGHQHHPAGDRRRHRVDDDGMVGTVTIGSKDGARGRRGRAPDRADPRPAHRRGRRRSTPARSSTSPSSVRSSTSSRAATACSTSPSSGGGKRIDRVEDVLDLGDEVEVRVDDIDNRARSRSRLAGDDARGRRGRRLRQR